MVYICPYCNRHTPLYDLAVSEQMLIACRELPSSITHVTVGGDGTLVPIDILHSAEVGGEAFDVNAVNAAKRRRAHSASSVGSQSPSATVVTGAVGLADPATGSEEVGCGTVEAVSAVTSAPPVTDAAVTEDTTAAAKTSSTTVYEEVIDLCD
uniref:Uncharacterized protein n=1 Tax=Lygus hesperus TaxID=30085 RepID=A0A0A9VMV3_LYGHE